MTLHDTDLPRLSRRQIARLKDHAREANKAHHDAVTYLAMSLDHARKAGKHLNASKEILPHGLWGEWLAANFKGSPRTARVYMLIDRRWDQLAEKSENGSVLPISIREALDRIAVAHGKHMVKHNEPPPHMRIVYSAPEPAPRSGLRVNYSAPEPVTHRPIQVGVTEVVEHGPPFRAKGGEPESAGQARPIRISAEVVPYTMADQQFDSLRNAYQRTCPEAKQRFRDWLAQQSA